MQVTAPVRIGLLTAWLSRNNGGVFESLVAHAGLIRDAAFTPVVIGLADQLSMSDRIRFGGIEVQALPVKGPPQFGYAPGLVEALQQARIDLLHLHGIWMYPSWVGARWATTTGKPYIISPHGMLDPWITARGKLKKAAARAGYERNGWRRATAFHALTEAEARDIASETGRKDTLVIPNAGPKSDSDFRRLPSCNIIYIGRIHPKKNLSALIEGWKLASDVLRPAGALLTIAGWGENSDVADLEREIALASDDSIRFVGPVYGPDKVALLGTARFAMLPSFSEGLPVAMLEAWAAGTPTLMSRHCHLPDGFLRGASLDTGTSAETIAMALRSAIGLSDAHWSRMSAAAYNLARTTFSADRIGQSWRDSYLMLIKQCV